VPGTTSAAYVTSHFLGNIKLTEKPRFSDCVTALANSEVDAVTTDDVILAGFAAQPQYQGKLKVVGVQRVVMGPGLGHNLVPEVGDSTPFRMCGVDHTVQCMFSTGTDWRSRRMRERELKEDLHRQLRGARAAVLWKLDGLSEYDVRRPLVPTGTNLLGLVKHLATVEWGHFGAAFGDPLDEHLPWVAEDTEASADMWVAPTETRGAIVGLYKRVAARSDEVIERLPLDAVGHVPWWPPEISRVTLHGILAHTVAEAQRHAGHADILRELVDGSTGHGPAGSLLPSDDAGWWRARFDRLERAAAAGPRAHIGPNE
jgi:Protein of unknown function (DUF664)